jgi:hypothetical protein
MQPHFDHGEAAAADVIFQYQGRSNEGVSWVVSQVAASQTLTSRNL